jgi:hypothetical protein
MPAFSPRDANSRPLVPDKLPAHPDFVLARSKVVRNGTVVWLWRKPD